MAWCPKCKNEYREGISVCADCGCELVDEEPMDEKELLDEEADESWEEEAEEDSEQELLQDEEATADGENTEASQTENAVPFVYQNSEEKAEDNRSSAWTLIVVGIVGIIVLVLGWLGFLPFAMNVSPFVYAIMAALFIFFLIMGISSMKNAKIFAQKAEKENVLRETLIKWSNENLKAEEIDACIPDAQKMAQEILYFRRTEQMKQKLNHQFLNLDQALLDRLIDEIIYDNVFGKEA